MKINQNYLKEKLKEKEKERLSLSVFLSLSIWVEVTELISNHYHLIFKNGNDFY